MENSNVNNLNGVPNFGHGFEETVPEVIPEVIQEPSIDEVVEDTETEDKPKKAKKK